MQTNSKSKVKRIIGYSLAAITTLVGFSILYFWFGMLKPYIEKLEQPRVPLLKKIQVAQTKFNIQDMDKDGFQDFANLKELIKTELLTNEEIQKAGIVMTEAATEDSKNHWWAIAQPLHPGQGRSFFINHTGKIYYTANTPQDLASRINRKTAEVPSGTKLLDKW